MSRWWMWTCLVLVGLVVGWLLLGGGTAWAVVLVACAAMIAAMVVMVVRM